MVLNWHITKEELLVIRAITDRAIEIAKRHDVQLVPMDVMMDIQACHANGCPLKLAELLAAEDFDFTHDVWGIMRHINRQTGQLEDCFLPRYAA